MFAFDRDKNPANSGLSHKIGICINDFEDGIEKENPRGAKSHGVEK